MSELRTLIKILICSPHSPLARVTHGVIAHFVTQPPAFLQGFLPLLESNRAAGTEAAAVLKPLPSFAAGAKGDAGTAGEGQDRALSAEPDPLSSLGTLGHHLSPTFHSGPVTILHFLDRSSGRKHWVASQV